MSDMNDPYYMTDDELKQEADEEDKKQWNVIADVVEAAVEFIADILDGAG